MRNDARKIKIMSEDEREEPFTKIKKFVVFILAFTFVGTAQANPVLNNVAYGNVQVQQSSGTTQVQQNSQQAIINWHSFNIGAGESTHFQQPAGGVALNRISPNQGASQIYGNLSATGKIILINQAGIFFGSSARVDVGGIIASTSDITNENFLAGKYIFNQPGSGYVVNQGTITAAQHGLVALIGNNVSNDGTITAHGGYVVLASGTKFTVNLSGDDLINFTVDEGITSTSVGPDGKQMRNGVNNSGMIYADGGKVVMTAKAASGVLDRVINMEGVAQARSVSQKNGEIILSGSGGVVRVAGKVDVSGRAYAHRGGKVKIMGEKVLVDKGAKIDASGDAGGGEILMGGDYQGKTPVSIFDGLQVLANSKMTLIMPEAEINADAITSGDGGKIIAWGDDATGAYGSFTARGGASSGNGGFVETSGHYLEVNGIHIDLSAAHGETGTWLLDPSNVIINNSATSGISYSAPTYTPTAGASNILASELVGFLNGGANVVVTTTYAGGGSVTPGSITVASPISWSSSNTLTLAALGSTADTITINSNGASPMIQATGSGNLTLQAGSTDGTGTGTITINGGISLASGTLNLSAANTASSITTGANGTISVRNFILNNGRWSQNAGSLPSFSASNDFEIKGTSSEFKRVLAGTGASGNDYQITDIYGLQGLTSIQIQEGTGLFFKQINNIDATGTSTWNSGIGWVPLGLTLNAYSQRNLNVNYNGQGFVINGLTINTTTSNYNNNNGLGFIANFVTGTVQNVGLTNASIAINNTGTISANGSGNYAIIMGSLLGGGTLTNSFATGSLTVTGNQAVYIGGLVGQNGGTISSSYNAATVSAANDSAVGGIVGGNNPGTISNVYNIGAISGNGASVPAHSNGGIGGIVGEWIAGTIKNSYSSGAITASSNGGGAVGTDPNGLAATNMTNTFWDSGTSLQATSAGSTGAAGYKAMTTAQMMTAANFTNSGNGFVTGSGWNTNSTFTSAPAAGSTNTTWYIFDGLTRPILGMEYSSTNLQTAHSLQLIAKDATSLAVTTYALGRSIDASGTVSASDVWGGSTPKGFVPIGTSSSPFLGSFNGNSGNGYKISSLTIGSVSSPSSAQYVGLFGYVGNSSYTGGIQNLTLDTPTITASSSGTNYVGGVVGYLFGASSSAVLLNNVTVSGGTITATTNGLESGFGGLVGYLNNGGTLTNVSNSAAVSGASSSTGGIRVSTAGIIGFVNGGGFTITNANNSGTIQGNTTNQNIQALAGGIIAEINVTTVASAISNTSNTGAISIGGNNGANDTAGGLIGQMANGGNLTISNSYNTGTISPLSSASAPALGGLVGSMFSTTISINSSFNQGNVGNVAGSGVNGAGILGGIVGLLQGGAVEILNFGNSSTAGVFNTGSVTSSLSASSTSLLGGFVGQNASAAGGSITIYNSYNLGAVEANSTTNTNDVVGGFIGTNSRNASINNSFEAGYITNPGGGITKTGALVGTNSSTLSASNAFWDVSTTGIGSDGSTTGAVGNNGSITGATGLNTTHMQGTGAGTPYNVFPGSLWGIINTSNPTTTSYPYLLAFYPSTPRVISGTLSAAGQTVNLVNNGTAVSNAATSLTNITLGSVITGASGSNYYYFIESNGTITDGNDLLAYIAGSNTNTVIDKAPTSGGSINGLSAAATNGIYIGATSDTVGLSNQDLYNAVGSLTTAGTSGLLYQRAAGSNNISILNGTNFITNNTTQTYTINGTITPASGNLGTVTFNGPVSLGTNVALNAGSNAISFNSTLNGAQALALTTTGTTTFSDVVGGVTPLTSINISSGGTTQINTSGITTTTNGAQTYGSNVTLAPAGSSVTLTGGDINFSGTISGAKDFIISMSGTGTASGVISNLTSFTKAGIGTLTLSGLNTYTGVTTITGGGVLSVSTLANGGSPSNIGAASNSAANLVLDNGTILYTGNIVGTDRLFSLTTNGGTLSVAGTSHMNWTNQGSIGLIGTGTHTLTLTGPQAGFLLSLLPDFDGSNPSFLTKTGTGIWTLFNSYNYTGTTSINAGTLQLLSAADTLPDTSPVVIASGATLDVNGKIDTIGPLSGAGSITLAGGTLTVNQLTDQTFSGAINAISNGGSIVKTGAGKLTLSGSSSYTGSTSVLQGILSVGTLANGGSPSNIGSSTNAAANLVLNGGTLQYTGGAQNTDRLFTVTTNGTIDSSGSGALSFTNSGSLSSNSGALLTITGSNDTTLTPILGGTSALTKNGSGVLTLLGANSYTGTTTISSGTLKLGASGVIANASPVTLANTAGVFFDVNGQTETVGTLSGGGTTGGTISLNGGALTVTQGSDQTYAGFITGTGSFTKAGANVLTLSGVNTYTGKTIINAGTLSISAQNNLGANPGVLTADQLTLNGGTLATTATFSLNDSNRGITLGASGGTFNVASGTTLTLPSVITGVTGLTKTSTGTLLLTGANNYTGATTISAGILEANNDSALGTSSVSVASGGELDIDINRTLSNVITSLVGVGAGGGGALVGSGSGTSTFSGNITLGGAGRIAAGSGNTLNLTGSTITNSGSLLTFVATGTVNVLNAISGTGGLTKNNNGLLKLSGTSNYSGNTSVNGGILEVNNATSALGTGGSVSVSTGTLQIDVGSALSNDISLTGTGSAGQGALVASGIGNATLSGNISTSSSSATLISSGQKNTLIFTGTTFTPGKFFTLDTTTSTPAPGNISIANNITGSQGITKTGEGTLTLTGLNTSYTGAITISAGTLQVGNNGTSGSLGTGDVTNSGILVFKRSDNLTASNNISGSGALRQTGAGTLILSGNNTYTGVTTISSGVLSVSSLANGGVASGIGQSTNSAANLVINGGALQYTGGTTSTDRLFTVGASGGTVDASGSSGTLTFSNTNPLVISSNATLTFTGTNVNDNVFNPTIVDNVSPLTSVVKNGTGTWVLAGANTYTGTTTVSSGVLSVSSLADGGVASGIGQSTNDAANLVLNGGTLKYTGAAASTDRLFTVGSSGGAIDASGSGALNFSNTGSLVFNGGGASTLTLTGTNSNNNILSSVVSDGAGATSLDKESSGTWILTNANSYSGSTTIGGGILQIGTGGATGSLGTGSVTNNASLVFNRNNLVSINNVIGGTGSVTQAGSDELRLSGDNSYQGGTNVNSGEVTIGHVHGLGTGLATVLSGAILNVSSSLGIIANDLNLVGTGGGTGALVNNAVNTFSGAIALNGNTSVGGPGTTTLSGILSEVSGTPIFTKIGSGTYILSGANTYHGATHVNEGTLSINSSGALGNTSDVNVISGSAINFATPTVSNTVQITLNGSGLSTGGALTFSDNANTVLNNAIVLGSHSTLGGSSDGTITGVIDGAFNLTKAGNNTITLSGSNTYGGNTIINAGAFSIAADSGLGTAPVSPTAGKINFNGGTLQTTAGFTLDSNRGINLDVGNGTISPTSGTLIYGGIIAGSGALSKTGSGTFRLTGGSNTYTGATTIDAGILQAANANVFDSTSSVAVNSGGTLDVDSVTVAKDITISGDGASSIGALTGTGTSGVSGNVTLAANSRLGGVGTLTLSGVVGETGGSQSITKVGSGTVILSNNNTYSGDTTISQGVVSIGADSALGAAPGSPTAAKLVLNGGALATTGDFSLNNNRGIALSGAGGTISTTSGTLTYSGIMAGGASSTFSKSGIGTLILSGVNTYSGSTAVNAGTLSIGADSGLGTAPGSPTANQLTLNGGTLKTTANLTLDSNRGIALGAGNGTFSVDPSTTLTYNGVMAGSGALTKSSGGTLVLGGVNTYSGATTVNGGVLSIAADSGLGTAPGVATPAQLILQNLSTLQTTSVFTLDANRGISLASGSGGVIQTDADLTYGGVIADSGTFTKSGSAKLILTGSNTYNGFTFINDGALQIGNGGTTGTLGSANVTNFSSLIFNRSNAISVGNAISGTGSLTQDGSDVLTLSANNAYTGGTHINSGTITMGHNHALGSGLVTVEDNAVLNVGSSLGTIANNLNLRGSGISSGGALVNAGANTFSGGVTLSDDTSVASTGLLTMSGVIDDGVSTFALTKVGSGSLTLSGNNTFDGGVNVNAGTVTIGHTAGLGTGLATVGDGAVLNVSSSLGTIANNLNLRGSGISSGGALVNAGSNTFSGGVTLSDNSSIGSTGLLTISGVINDAGSTLALTKVGSGSLTLSGNNTFDGGVNVNAGTVTIGHTAGLGTGLATVGDGAVLNVSSSLGTIANDLNLRGSGISSGGALVNAGTNTFSGGVTLSDDTSVASTGSLTMSGVINDAGSTLALTKVGSGSLALSGNNTFDGGVNVNEGTVTIGHTAGLGTGLATVEDGAVLSVSSTLGTIANDLNLRGAGIGSNGALVNAGTNTFSGGVTLSDDTSVASTGSLTMSGVIDDAASTFALTKLGGGTLTFTGNNTYGGDTIISAGTLQIGNGGSSGTFGTGNVIDNSALVFNRNNALGVSNIISGSGSVKQSGSNVVTLSGNNSYQGGTQIDSGTISIGHVNALGTGLAIVGDGAVLSVSSTLGTIANNLNLRGSGISSGGALVNAGSNIFSGGVTLSDNSSIGSTGLLTISGVINDAGSTLALTKVGSGSLTLSGNNTFDGGVNVSEGTVTIGNTAGLGTGLATVEDGAVLSVSSTLGTIANDLNLRGSGISSGGALVNAGTNTFSGGVTLSDDTSVASTGSLTMSGVINDAGSTLALTKVGSGSLTLSGNNTFDGGVNVNEGTVTIGHTAGLGTGLATVEDGAVLRVSSSLGTIANNLNLRGSGINSGGALVNAGTNTFSGGVTLSDDTSVASTGSLTMSGVINDAGSTLALTKVGSGSLTLSGNNTFDGGVNVNEGTVTIGHIAGLGTGLATVEDGAVLSVSSTLGTIANDLNLRGAGIGGNGALVNAGTNTFSGGVTLSDDTSVASTGSLTMSGVINDAGSTLALTKVGSGSLTLSGNNTFDGGVNVNEGTVTIGHIAGLGTGLATVEDGAVLSVSSTLGTIANDLNLRGSGISSGGALVNAGTNTFSGGVTLSDDTSVASTGSLTMSGVINDAGSTLALTKVGSGSLTLSGNNTFDGGVNVNEGTVTIGHTAGLGTGLATVEDGAVLSVSSTLGTIANDLNLRGSGISSSGALANAGANTFSGDVTLSGNSTIGSSNALTLSGAVDGGFELDLAGSGSVNLAGVVGSGVALSGLTSNIATTLSGGSVTTSGAQAYNAATTLGADTTLNSGAINTTLGTLNSSGNKLTMHASGSITANNFSGNGDLTISNSAGTSFSGAVNAGTVTLTNTTSGQTIAFNGGLTATTLATAAQPYAVQLNGATITNATTFSNTGDVTLAGTNTFTGGLTSTASTTKINGTVNTTNTGLMLGAVTVDGTSALKSGSGVIAINGAIDGTGQILALQDASSTGSVTLSGNVTLEKLNTGAGAYAVSLFGANNTIKGDSVTGTIFSNTNGVTLGNGSDVFTFTNGLTSTASATNLASTISAPNKAISLGTSVLNAASSLSGGTVSIGAISGSNSLGLTSTAGTTLGGTVNIGSLTSTGTTTISTANITTTGTQTYNNAVTLGTGTTFNSGANDITFSGQVSGSGSITQASSGIMKFFAINNYSGATNINSGTLQQEIGNAVSSSSAVTVESGATFNLKSFNGNIGSLAGAGTVTLGTGFLTTGNDGTSTSYSGQIGGSGGLTKVGAGIFTLSNSNNYTGATNVNGGKLVASVSGVFSSTNSVNVGSSGTLDFNANNTIGSLAGSGIVNLGAALTTGGNNSTTTFSGALNGAGSLVKAGSGNFTLSGSNTYGGTTTINLGQLSAGALNAFSPNSAVTMSAGTLSLGGFDNTIPSLAGTGGTVSLGAKTLTTGDSTSTSFSGTISGVGGGLIKQGSGTFTVSGSNTYSGATTINGGTLKAGAANILSSLSAVTINSGELNLDIYNNSIGSLAGSGLVSLGTGNLTAGGNGASTTFIGAIQGSGNFTKSGAGTLILSGVNTLTGQVNANVGTLQLNVTNALPTSVVMNIGGSGTFKLNNISATIGSLSGSGTVNLGSGVLTAGGNNTAMTYSGTITGSGGITKTGTANFNLQGANNYSGATTVNGGALIASNSAALGTSAVTVNGASLNVNGISLSGISGVTLQNNATLTGQGPTSSLSTSGITLSGANKIQSISSTFTVQAPVNGAGDLTVQGSGIVRFMNDVGMNTSLSSVTATTTVNLAGVTVKTANNQTYNAPITLSGASSLVSTGGALSLGAVNGSNNLTINSAGTTTFGNTVNVASVDATGSVLNLNGSSITTSGTQHYASPVMLGADVTLTTSNNNITFDGVVDGTQALNLNSGSGTVTFNGIGQSPAPTSLVSNGSGTVIFNGDVGTSGTPVGNISIAGATQINGDVYTSGDQTYQGAVQLGNPTNDLTVTNAGNISINNGVSGNTLNLNGGSGGSTFTLSNSSTLSNLNVTGTGGTNTLSLQTPDAQNWLVSSSNTGTADVSGITSTSFSGVQDIVGNGSGNNVLDLTSYSSPVQLYSNTSGIVGTTTFNNINTINSTNGSINLVTGESNAMVVTGANSSGGIGYINDPIFFNGFNTYTGTSGHDTVSFNGVPFTWIQLTSTNAKAIVNGFTLFFINISLLNPIPPNPPVPPNPTPIINNIINQSITANNIMSIDIPEITGSISNNVQNNISIELPTAKKVKIYCNIFANGTCKELNITNR